jgi:hypothetical protein
VSSEIPGAGGKPGGIASSGSWDRQQGHQTLQGVTKLMCSGTVLEHPATAGKSPVREMHEPPVADFTEGMYLLVSSQHREQSLFIGESL